MKFMPPNSPGDFEKPPESEDEFEKQLSTLSLIKPSSEYHKLASNLVEVKNSPHVTDGKSWFEYAAIFGFTCIGVAGVLLTMWNSENAVDGARVSETAVALEPLATVTGTEQTQQYEAGTHYRELILPAAVDGQQLADIQIFFSYPCFPCFEFEKIIADWASTTSSQAEVAYVPAIWSEETRHYARVFYTTERLGIQPSSHQVLYEALHQDELLLEELPILARFFTAFGVSQQQFLSAFNSEDTLNQVRDAELANRNYRIQSVPSLVVDCQYYITLNSEIEQGDLLQVAETLLNSPNQGNAKSC